ncbi:hypothetical protein ELH21_09220 [Rhizobium leguminosarum]|uniref:hypothetical protein n=1 Tax=Rhizobium leguminosarum TaxID=384 RepID=UPI001031110D|nr:hypothetical protein [Rhizobium leguminosarum]TBD04558.1 hypothetical protein ELH21_09220 [Rhizobium leguminosarum]
MKKSTEEVSAGLIASTMSTEEYAALRANAERILNKIPVGRQGQSKSRTVGALFKSMDESFKIIGRRTDKRVKK